MCGIVGCFQREPGRSQPPVAVGPLLQKIRHRGPDDLGVYNNSRGVLAQTRLSIIDVPGGHQPMCNEDKRLWITYNGEIYNFWELREPLRERHDFKTRSDTEVTLHLYEEDGPDCVRHFDGMFAFALLDGDDLFLARDPLGVKPLYTAERDGWLYFASEMKVLLPLRAPIEEFPPGHWLHSRYGTQPYFELERWVAEADISKPLRALHESMQQAVKKRLVADVPVGVFLSGGLDSSLVAALMRSHVDELHSFSVGMPESLDLRYARKVADFLKTTHHERVFTEQEMRAVLPRVIYHLESFDFALVRSAIANYFVAELASEFLKVVLVGEGSDEIFAGYHYLKDLSEEERLRELFRITLALHNSNLQRVDRMTMAHGLEGREPYLDLNLLQVAFNIPLELKQNEGVEKWALRKAFEGYLPDEVLWRTKEKFSRGAGSALVMEKIAEREISDQEFERERALSNGLVLRSKEELYYYRIFRKFFPESLTGCLSWTAAPERR